MSAEILDKIRKLRALATSSNVHEAAAAARAAERLIQEHEIAEAELLEERDEPVESEQVATFGSRIPAWRSYLLSSLAQQYGCSYVRLVRRLGRTEQVYRAFGRRADLATLIYQYAFFVLEIDRLATAHARGKSRTWGRSFRLGAVVAIAQALRAARDEVRASASSSALVALDRRALAADDAVARAYPDLRTARKRPTEVDGCAFRAGHRAGSSLHQRSALSATGAKLLEAGR